MPRAQPSLRVFENRLQPFTSDGCSRFFDGPPVVDPKRWQKCCIQHDIAYWRGGTPEERERADRAMDQCIEGTGHPAVAGAMYLGVRIGGFAGFPTTWHWGYGWMLERGDGPLRPDEERQVRELSARIPKDLDQIPVKSAPTIRDRETFSGNRCLDLAVVEIQKKLGRSFHIMQWKETQQEKSDGFWKQLSIKPDGCREPFRFTFQLLLRDACSRPTNEVVARGRIRLRNVVEPKSVCAPPPH